MSIYLHDIPLSEAQKRLYQALEAANRSGLLGSEYIPLDEKAVDRILAEPVWARLSSPHYHASAMDGFAVRARDTAGAMPTQPVRLSYHDLTVYVDTGDPLPVWADAVIPIENVEAMGEGENLAQDPRRPESIRIRAAVTPWQHVRSMGEDIVATELVLPAGHRLRPVDLGAVAACGHDHVLVAQRPRVAILPTGSELVPVGAEVKRGDIIEYNSIVLAGQVISWGGEPRRHAIIPDDFERIKEAVKEAARSHDLILLNAGSSAGSEDFSAKVVEELGELLVHGVAVRPGHPVILGMVHLEPEQGEENLTTIQPVPIIGVPGYPVSAALTGEIFVKPLLWRWQGAQPESPITVKAELTRKVTSPPGDDDYLRVAVGRVGKRMLAAPLSRGAGVITSLVKADGLVILPRGSQGIPAGQEVDVQLLRSPGELEKTIFAIGSHDLTLDLMGQFLAESDRRFTSANVGSLGGLVALRRGEAHLAGSHLLDPESGEYNLAYIRQYLPEIAVVVVALVGRTQGLLVAKDNPKRIQTLDDLTRPEVTFVNRQRGAGTRVLLDYELGKLRVNPEAIQGYNQEEYTHLAVAAAISSGRADCGLGIAAAAQSLDLDFLPLFEERYDLVIPAQHYRNDLLKPLIDLLKKPAFQEAVAQLPGYTVHKMGSIIAELET
ncbi:MAG: molybdopterin biosynthesis protein [Anaerolineales bacterium]|nr:MAG: molybdopterin biosynthesis protein [Anaerolineales bacterium]